jgi:chromate transporter
VLLSVLAGVYLNFGDVPAVQGIFYAIKPAVVAVVLFAAWRIGSKSIKNGVLLGIAVLAFIGIFVFDLDFPWIVLGAAILGAVGGKLMPAKFKAGGGHGASNKAYGPALIDDDTPPPAHAKFTWTKLAVTTLVFAAIAAASLLALRGSTDLYNMGEFFLKAAFLTIGGAYAVLPYVYQGAVDHFTWLTGPQMMDGLALGETTPGPLIMIVTWVGYMGGVTKDRARQPCRGWAGRCDGSDLLHFPAKLLVHHCRRPHDRVDARRTQVHRAAHCHLGRCRRRDPEPRGLLRLAHLLAQGHGYSMPFSGPFDAIPVVIAIACFIALWKYKADIMKVIGVCALLGLAYSFFM